ncbi:peptide-methionine (S)-S-oxide reductase MsrA [Nocardioides fonticola]|uniref:Peptide methionine sulfoxide reductase MsrA n=1 Tax=Nocardioides fonticola TaxID=450363 RepID=A0ABP7XHI5_9ACTN
MFFTRKQTSLVDPAQTLPGRTERAFPLSETHLVLGTPLTATPGDGTTPADYEVALFGLGCFWGAEEIYWQLPGVYSTSVGYAGGTTPNPSYEEVCSGLTNHTEAVRIVFDPARVSYADLVKLFFEVHDPTQGMRQGNDVGTQYRSAIYWTTPEQQATAAELTKIYGEELARRGLGEITTEVREAPTYYFAEDHHQQYLAVHVNGYRCHANTGVKFPTLT